MREGGGGEGGKLERKHVALYEGMGVERKEGENGEGKGNGGGWGGVDKVGKG